MKAREVYQELIKNEKESVNAIVKNMQDSKLSIEDIKRVVKCYLNMNMNINVLCKEEQDLFNSIMYSLENNQVNLVSGSKVIGVAYYLNKED